ncbi:MAG: FAD-dependent oxidoreductase [Proteobacteria bacterium]|nr:FAD-dependent oxidoreductase [Pseudomonadota bacterium]
MRPERFRVKVPDLGWFEENIGCENACPVNTDAPAYIAAIMKGDFDKAFEINRGDNLFPAILGRICVHPCEEKCRRGIQFDRPISICSLKRASADFRVQPTKRRELDEIRRKKKKDKKVAIIGAGPSGLAAANDLARMGYRVTVYESLPVKGGMLNVGIPPYRLPRQVVEEAFEELKYLGVHIQTNTAIGWEIKLEDLRRDYDAVYIAAGAHKAEKLGIRGEELDGVVHGVTFMRQVNLEETDLKVGRRIAVIGGGNTAIDTARSSLRLGAEEVNILYRRTRAEMPVDERELEEAEIEGIRINYLTSPVEVLTDDGQRVTGIRCIRNRLGEPDESGRRRPVPVEGSEFGIPCDMVIPAVSQSPDISFLPEEVGLEVSKWDRLVVDPDTFQTNIAGIFAGGDFVTGPRDVIRVIADGRRAAVSIDLYLSRKKEPRKREAYFTPMGDISLERDLEKIPRHRMPTLPPGRRDSLHEEVDLGFSRTEAVGEAKRCFQCYIFTIFDRKKCILCGGCVDVCPRYCFRMVKLDEIEGDEHLQGLVERFFGVPLERIWNERGELAELGTAMIKEESRCIQCGLCAKRCPTGAISMELFHRATALYED